MLQLQVRLQSKGGRHSSVVFCTNGILLRVLVGKGSVSCVSDITHIIVVLDIFLFIHYHVFIKYVFHIYSWVCGTIKLLEEIIKELWHAFFLLFVILRFSTLSLGCKYDYVAVYINH